MKAPSVRSAVGRHHRLFTNVTGKMPDNATAIDFPSLSFFAWLSRGRVEASRRWWISQTLLMLALQVELFGTESWDEIKKNNNIKALLSRSAFLKSIGQRQVYSKQHQCDIHLHNVTGEMKRKEINEE